MTHRPFSIAFCSVLLAACAAPEHAADKGAEAAVTDAGFNADELDPNVRPQDDFFAHVNGRWLDATPIPAERSRYGTFTVLFEETERQVRALVEESTSPELAKVRNLYKSFMDDARAEQLGTTPLKAELDRVDAVASRSDIVDYMAHALTHGIQVPLDFYIDASAENPDQPFPYFWQSGLGLPDRDYYLSDNERLADVRDTYNQHIARMYAAAGWAGGEGAADIITRIERRIAQSHWTRVQNRDRERIYTNRFSLSSAQELSGDFDWPRFLARAGFGAPDTIILAQTDYFAELAAIIAEFDVAEWQQYFRFKVLKAFAPYLSAAIVSEDFDFQGRTLRGRQKMLPRWKRAVRLVNSALGEEVGRAYVAEHFPPESKRRVEEMIENLRRAFSVSIEQLDWMSAATKKNAQKKLARFSSKIGYPDKWRDYSSLAIDPDDLAGNVQRARAFEHNRQTAKLGKPVDRTEWGMTPQTVNAYYRPTMNEIVFPAAILQTPFFDPGADDALNYGAIGSVIGHEFSHGFDDQGRKFAGDGRLNDWWTKADASEYVDRSQVLVEQYDGFRPLADQAINGRLTLGENIADLAGVIMAYRAWTLSLNGETAPVIDGFTGAERFFIGYAIGWRTKYRDEFLREILLSDPHSPSRYRVVGPLRNVTEFYDTYNVKPGDGMYIEPDARVKIW